MNKIDIKNRRLNGEKLLSYGFERQADRYVYTTVLTGSQMELTLCAYDNGSLFSRVTDNFSGDEYVLHLIPDAVGAFVGQVRAEYEAVIEDILSNCFDSYVFKSRQALDIIAYIGEKYGDELEFLWEKFPDNAIFRRKDNKKWYATILTVSRRKLGLDSDEIIEIINLGLKPEELDLIADGEKYFRGYHMNKKHWITLCLDGTVSDGEIFDRIDNSYVLAKK